MADTDKDDYRIKHKSHTLSNNYSRDNEPYSLPPIFRVGMGKVPSMSGQQEMEDTNMTHVLLMAMPPAFTPLLWAL